MNKIEEFYINWIGGVEDYLRDYLRDIHGNLLKPRLIYKTLQDYVHKLLAGELTSYEKIVLLPGLRGVGKTTLLAQLYFYHDFLDICVQERQTFNIFRLYVSVDRLQAFGISLLEFYKFLKINILPKHEKHKILLLFDEIQYDSQWALFLKLLFDENVGNKNLLVFATGSSALLLNTQNTDLVRRTLLHRILPENFVEFLYLHKDVQMDAGLSNSIREALFLSKNAQEVYTKLSKIKPMVVHEFAKIKNPQATFKEYLYKGSLPFSAVLPDALAMQKIREMVLVNIVQKDILQFGRFESNVLVQIPNLLMLLAHSDEITTGKLAQTLGLSVNTVNRVLDTLKKTELLIELLPYGQPYAQVRKSPKFLFVSPNIRVGLLQGLLSKVKGKLLEDYFALIYEHYLSGMSQILHDYSKGGADFVIRFIDNSEIVVEIGFDKDPDGVLQVLDTMQKTSGRAKYGLVIGASTLKLEKVSYKRSGADIEAVQVPLEFLWLV